MSHVDFTSLPSKSKSFFFNFGTIGDFASGWFIAWPQGMSYAAWKNLLIRHLWFIGSRVCLRKPKNRRRSLHWKVIRARSRQRDGSVQTQIKTVVNELETCPHGNKEDVKLELITMLKKFLERKDIFQHIENTIPDRRNPKLITYSKQSVVMCALAIFLLRMGSGNKFDNKGHDADEEYSIRNMAKFIGAPEDRVPVIKTIEKFLKNLEENAINDLLISFFQDLLASKFFKQHPNIMFGDFFLLAADCVHTHTYDHLHHMDAHGNNDCPCCLKRVYHKGTEKEQVRWLHTTLVYCFVFMGKLKIPIYRYPIHAKQIHSLEDASEHDHKQECELVALKVTLPIIRQAFPRMKIVLLLDGLYANRPVLQLALEHAFGFIIVKKDDCLTTLGRECDEHAATLNHRKNCVKRCRKEREGWLIEERYEWFNDRYLGDDVTTHVLRFYETRTKEGKKPESYKCEWLFSWRLSENSCEAAVRQARARWQEEDLFNTLKNRDFALEHDYSRDPRSCFNWHGISLLAFGIFELFRFSECVVQRGDWPQATLAEKLLGQLLHRPTVELFSEKHLSKRIQFRYNFVVEPIHSKVINQVNFELKLKSG